MCSDSLGLTSVAKWICLEKFNRSSTEIKVRSPLSSTKSPHSSAPALGQEIPLDPRPLYPSSTASQHVFDGRVLLNLLCFHWIPGYPIDLEFLQHFLPEAPYIQ